MGSVVAWLVGPGLGLKKVGERSNCLVPSRGQVRALSELAGGREGAPRTSEPGQAGHGARLRDLCGVTFSPGPRTVEVLGERLWEKCDPGWRSFLHAA